jgi:hypothetical protein
MKKVIVILFMISSWLLTVTAWGFASEKILFADYTLDAGFSSLQDFFSRELHLSVTPLPEPSPSYQEITTSQYWEKLSSFAHLLFVAYEKDTLVFVELIDLHLRQEILSLVRTVNLHSLPLTLREEEKRFLL